MIHCDDCEFKPFCIPRLNDRTITGCTYPMYWEGIISKGEVVVEHTLKGEAE